MASNVIFYMHVVPFSQAKNFVRMDVTAVLQLHEHRIIDAILMEHDLKNLGFKMSDSSKASSVKSNYDSSQNGQTAWSLKFELGLPNCLCTSSKKKKRKKYQMQIDNTLDFHLSS